jgi:hypothetical protein
MTAAQLAAAGEPPALVAYLGQPGADPAVCDAGSPGPHVAIDDATDRALVDALRDGALAPAAWSACAERILASATAPGQRSLLEAVLAGYSRVLADPAVERDPRVQARLAALAAAYDLRSPDVRAPDAAAAVMAQLRAPGALGPIARRSAAAMLAALELDHGIWYGRAVDPALIDALAAQRDEAALAVLSVRIPDAALRDTAQRRLIRLRIAASPFPEVRDDAAHVEEAMMELGKNAISPRLQPPVAASVDPDQLALRRVLIAQAVRRQTAQLTALAPRLPASPGAAPPPAAGIAPLALRDALAIGVTGLSRPVALCGAARSLDPSPCLLPGDLAVAGPLARLDRDGALHFADEITARQVVELARAGADFVLPLAIAGRPLVSLRWPMQFAVPAPLVLAADGVGQDGPALQIAVEEHHGRLIYEIADGRAVSLAVAERGDAARFRIVSRGGTEATGASGADGADGMTGSDGTSATCPASSGGNGGDGGSGSDGGNGSDGGSGGNGGAIAVRITCDDGVCSDLVAALREAIASEPGRGGPGGAGGRGGTGGAGGRGGAGATCYDDQGNPAPLSGGMDGTRGSDGQDGARGSSGDGGRPGNVRFEVHRTTAAVASP